jgi:hypothetical protein
MVGRYGRPKKKLYDAGLWGFGFIHARGNRRSTLVFDLKQESSTHGIPSTHAMVPRHQSSTSIIPLAMMDNPRGSRVDAAGAFRHLMIRGIEMPVSLFRSLSLKRNKAMADACNLLHASLSAEHGCIGGTRFEAEYAESIGIPVQVNRENGNSEWIFQYSFPFWEGKQAFFLAWQRFFHKIRFELEGSR